MIKDLAVVFIYDDDTDTIKMCNVSRRSIQSILDRAMMLDIPEDPAATLSDKSAEKLGALALRCLGAAHPSLDTRLRLTANESDA